MAEKNILVCPKCGEPLFKTGGAMKCSQMHSFDLSSEGYVNLKSSSNAKVSGDSREMVAARHSFLECGYYEPLLELLADEAEKRLEKDGRTKVLIDAGCGEGYYTSGLTGRLEKSGYSVSAYGFDLSKTAVKTAARRKSSVEYAVASIFSLPVADGCADLVLSVFSPVGEKEFLRVLRPGGTLLIAAPGSRHLYGLKEILYEKPYLNSPNQFSFSGFENIGIRSLQYEIKMDSTPNIRNLLAMTPYFWRTPQKGIQKLSELTGLHTEISFELHVFKKV